MEPFGVHGVLYVVAEILDVALEAPHVVHRFHVQDDGVLAKVTIGTDPAQLLGLGVNPVERGFTVTLLLQ
ncbi:hypothetical protein D3C79_1088320 [compost metagenome]